MQRKILLSTTVYCGLISAGIGLAPGTTAIERTQAYGADMAHSVWQFADETTVCRLRHPVPEFGFAVVSRDDRGTLNLRLEAFQPVETGDGDATLLWLPPPWRHLDPRPERRQAPIHTGKRPLDLSGPTVDWLLRGLNSGYLASFEMGGERARLRVSLSPVNFAAGHRQFRDCVAALPPPRLTSAEAGFNDIRFASDKFALDAGDRSELNRLAAYLAEHPEVTAVTLSGHADSSGKEKHNEGLSRNRVDAVADYLVAAGVDPNRITRQHFGDRQPKADNQTPAGRAVNRRVELAFGYTPPEQPAQEQTPAPQ